ncbi:MAG TPA: ABC transporter ATP-binding protein, partial [bacterium]|nr:ABC transporter ATP-binding protein [bacterium]
SGSGKTTAARCVAGLEAPDEGRILIAGEEADFTAKAKRRKVQYIFQDTYGSLNPRMRIGRIIREPIWFHFGLAGEALENEARKILGLVGLSRAVEDKYPHELSGGQRQRAGIARALAVKPELLIADEPVSSLDVSVQAQILRLLLELNREGLSILLITHDLRVVSGLADYVAVMSGGKIEEQGETAKVFGAPESLYTKALLEAIPGRRGGN